MNSKVRKVNIAEMATGRARAGTMYRRSRSSGAAGASFKVAAASALRRKIQGQALIIIALCMFLLLACVGLAIDGGSMYTERRQAQNASDGAAMAGTGKMLTLYQNMVLHHSTDVDGSVNDEAAISSTIMAAAAKNGISVNSSNVQAYFVNDQKQIVTAASGAGGCGFSNPCQVGQNLRVPWVGGAKGIVVTTKAQTDAYLMQLFGSNKISAIDPSTAYMGVATNIDSGVSLLPIGFFTDTDKFNQLVQGNTYVLIQGSTSRGSGNWGYVDFSGNGSSKVTVDAWIQCGFTPSVVTMDQWSQLCPNAGDSRNLGPTQYWTGMNEPLAGPYYLPDLQWPPDPNGWWISGSSGTTNSTCQYFSDLSQTLLNHTYWLPVFDRNNGQGGNNTKFHLISIAEFRITSMDIACHKKDVTPTPGVPSEEHWNISGVFLQHWSPGASGQHGDVRHTSAAVVFLEP